jgi:hypothetical protein
MAHVTLGLLLVPEVAAGSLHFRAELSRPETGTNYRNCLPSMRRMGEPLHYRTKPSPSGEISAAPVLSGRRAAKRHNRAYEAPIA